MSLAQRPPNRLLQALPAAEFDALHPHLKPVEMVRATVLVKAGSAPTQIYLPHSGAISMTVGLSEGQMVEVAMIGKDGLVGASAALGVEIWPSDAVVLFPGTASVLDVAEMRAAADRNVTVQNLLARHELQVDVPGNLPLVLVDPILAGSCATPGERCQIFSARLGY